LFSGLCDQPGVSGNLVADALHAALAVEQGAVFATLDRDFGRFAGLRIFNPAGGGSVGDQ
jgi:predicted nucleic acid-binding protein